MAAKRETGPDTGDESEKEENHHNTEGGQGVSDEIDHKLEDQPTAPKQNRKEGSTEKSETETVTPSNNNELEAKTETIEEEIHLDEQNHMGRQQLFEKGLAFEEKGKEELGLKFYLQCIKGLESSNDFKALPQCLHHIADIYYKKQEYEKAIQFIQAEKMYYETALVDFGALQRETENKSIEEINDNKEKDPRTEKPEAVRADEYENLAKMCLEKKQPHLALEYQGKSSKMRQELFGDDHPITKKSLDFFTVIYGEVGKHQYAESIQKFDKDQDELSDSDQPTSSIMARRKSDTERAQRRASQQVRFQEIPETIPAIYGHEPQVREQEEWIANALLIILFFFCMIALSCVMFYIYCRIDGESRSCSAWKADIHYYYIRFKYWFYYYISPKAVG